MSLSFLGLHLCHSKLWRKRSQEKYKLNKNEGTSILPNLQLLMKIYNEVILIADLPQGSFALNVSENWLFFIMDCKLHYWLVLFACIKKQIINEKKSMSKNYQPLRYSVINVIFYLDNDINGRINRHFLFIR